VNSPLLRAASHALCVLAACAGLAGAGGSDDEARYTAELEVLAGTIAHAVTMRDTDTLLRYAWPEMAEEARRRLAKPDSGLACALFDTTCLQRHVRDGDRPRVSIADFFKRQPNARLRIHYLGMAMVGLGLDSPYHYALLTWVVPGSDADRKFPAHDLSRWSDDHVNTCVIYTKATGWRFQSDVGVFFCAKTLDLEPDPS
jgi:hypothetical protein